jgi:hypothetical protein
MNWTYWAPSSVYMNNLLETEMKSHVKKYNKRKCRMIIAPEGKDQAVPKHLGPTAGPLCPF